MKLSKTLKINKKLFPVKLHFFLFNAAMGALLPFHPSIGITRLGLGAGNLALVFTVEQFLYIVLKPIIGYIADYFNNIKAMIFILTVINAVLSYSLLVVPAIGNKSLSEIEKSQLRLQRDFCEVCNISDELQKSIELLPETTNLSVYMERAIPCDGANIQQTFMVYCSQMNSSSPHSFTVTNNMFSRSNCLSKNESIQNLGKNLFNYPHNSSITIMYMAINHNNLPQFIIMCPMVKTYTAIETNFTLDDVLNTCHRYPADKMPELATESTNLPTNRKSINCSDLGAKTKVDFEMNETNTFKTYQFWLFALFLTVSCACTSSISTLSDTACHESAQLTGADYGKQRAWGSIGWGLMAPFAGFLNDYTDSYLAAMILMTILNVLQTWNLCKMDLIKPQLSQNILNDIKIVLASVEFIAFNVSVLFNGIGIGIVWFYLAWFINDIGGSRLLLGLAHAIQCFLGEMPLMFISGWIIKKIGHFNVITVSLMGHCVRFLAYSSLNNPWLILPIECLDGVTFGLFYTAMTSYGKLNSMPGTEATTQSLLCSTYEGLGAGLGCVVAGICFDYYGGYTTFFYTDLCFAAAAAINIGSTVLLHFIKGSLELKKENETHEIRY